MCVSEGAHCEHISGSQEAADYYITSHGKYGLHRLFFKWLIIRALAKDIPAGLSTQMNDESFCKLLKCGIACFSREIIAADFQTNQTIKVSFHSVVGKYFHVFILYWFYSFELTLN